MVDACLESAKVLVQIFGAITDNGDGSFTVKTQFEANTSYIERPASCTCKGRPLGLIGSVTHERVKRIFKKLVGSGSVKYTDFLE